MNLFLSSFQHNKGDAFAIARATLLVALNNQQPKDRADWLKEQPESTWTSCKAPFLLQRAHAQQ
jgi:hypothetical protein